MTTRMSPATNRRLPVLIGAAVAVLVSHSTIATAAVDDDHDGWYTAEQNQRATLTVAGLTYTGQGRYYVLVEGVRFPHTETKVADTLNIEPQKPHSTEWHVARRAVGTWMTRVDDGKLGWKTLITVTRLGSPTASGSTTVHWHNRPGEQNAVVTVSRDEEVRLDLRVSIERFKDPDPDDRRGDADCDGILDFEEADYARRGIGLGDPDRPDLILVAGHTHPDWRMTELSKTLLRTRFAQRGIHLHIAATDDEGLGLCRPGLMELGGKTLARDHALSVKEARRMRKACLKSPLSAHAHLLVLSARVSPNARTGYGWAELPGATFVVRSHFPVLGPDFHQYQAKTIMHELGHNLGLCHPTQSDESCMTGAIPQSERDPAGSVMGTPKTDRSNRMAQLKNAWARPLDYSPTQWSHARLDWVRRENRPRTTKTRR